MRRRVLTALLAVALSAAMVPGMAAAAAGGNSAAAKNCQVDYAGFKNRGQCTSFYAKQNAQLRPQTRYVVHGY